MESYILMENLPIKTSEDTHINFHLDNIFGFRIYDSNRQYYIFALNLFCSVIGVEWGESSVSICKIPIYNTYLNILVICVLKEHSLPFSLFL